MKSPRRSQAERRSATRGALLGAAQDCLVEAGLAGFTTTEVCRRAALSQGALFKHFPAKSALLAATTEYLFDQLRADFERAFLALPARRRTARHGLELLWDQMFDARLGAAFELYAAARTDAELRAALGPVVAAHLERTHELAISLLGGADPRRVRDVVDLVTLAIQGLVIDQMALPDPSHRRRLRRFLTQLARCSFPNDVYAHSRAAVATCACRRGKTVTHEITRRRFVVGSGAGVLLAAAAAASRASRAARADGAPVGWRNWSGSQRVSASAVLYPRNEAELVRAVREASGSIRCFGGGHSFCGLVPTRGTLISLEAMTGLVDHDAAAVTATLGAGTRILIGGDLLAGVGQSLFNQPDINLQSFAGAISTATHGTGLSLQCLSAYVRRLKLVLADGSVVVCSPTQDRELFEAARVSMGSCGVISEITFQNLPAYRLREHTRVMELDAALQLIDERKGKDRHIEFFAFPFGGKAIVKQLNLSTEAVTPEPESTFDQNEVLELAAKTVRAMPWTKSLIQRVVGSFVGDTRRVADAHRIFPTARAVAFNEMEYSVPAEHGIACLQEIIDTMRKRDLPVFFPLEYRYIAGDEVWLSPFYQRAGASISVHQYAPQSYHPLFDALEPVLVKYRGRPHWGKLHTRTSAQLRELYPKWDDFLAVRRRVDPQGRFLNAYMHELLGVSS